MGDPACWLHRTCPACARVLEDTDRAAGRCERCGAELTDDDEHGDT